MLFSREDFSGLDYSRTLESLSVKHTFYKEEDLDVLDIINSLCGEDLERWQESLHLAQNTLMHHYNT